MKKNTLLYILGSIALISCGNQNNNAENAENDSTKVAPKKSSVNIIKKELHVAAPFTHLTSITGATIEYTQGNYRMELEGDSILLKYLETDYESGLLAISFASERNMDINRYETKLNLTVRISAPDLKCVSLCSCGDFISKGIWKGSSIEFGGIGSGSFICDSIQCTSLNYQSSGTGSATFAHIQAPYIHFANTNTSDIDASLSCDTLQAENIGNSTFTFKGTAKLKEIHPTKYGKIVIE